MRSKAGKLTRASRAATTEASEAMHRRSRCARCGRAQRRASGAAAGCAHCSSESAPAEREAERIGRWLAAGSLPAPTPPRERPPQGGSVDEPQGQHGTGRPLPPALRERFSGALGTDLGDVRVHTDDHAHRFAVGLEADALTLGSDIYFRHGAYDPFTAQGQATIGHEVVHTIQQRDVAPAVQRQRSAREDDTELRRRGAELLVPTDAPVHRGPGAFALLEPTVFVPYYDLGMQTRDNWLLGSAVRMGSTHLNIGYGAERDFVRMVSEPGARDEILDALLPLPSVYRMPGLGCGLVESGPILIQHIVRMPTAGPWMFLVTKADVIAAITDVEEDRALRRALRGCRDRDRVRVRITADGGDRAVLAMVRRDELQHVRAEQELIAGHLSAYATDLGRLASSRPDCESELLARARALRARRFGALMASFERARANLDVYQPPQLVLPGARTRAAHIHRTRFSHGDCSELVFWIED